MIAEYLQKLVLRHKSKARELLTCLTPAALIFSASAPAHSLEAKVEVELFKAREPLRKVYIRGPLTAQANLVLNLERGIYELVAFDGKVLLSATEKSAKRSIISARSISFKSSSPVIFVGTEKDKMRAYRGSLSLMSENGSLILRNKLAMKDYLNSVLGSETLPDFPQEALKAQAVLIQTLMARYKAGDLINDSTEKQAYSGAQFERPQAREALRQCWGKTLRCGKQPVSIYFHAACAGGTSTVELFGKSKNICACQKRVKCDYCKASPFWKNLKHTIPADIFDKNFPEGVPVITKRDESGRALELVYSGSKRKTSGYQFWLEIGQKLGWDKMPGTRFEIEKLANGDILLSSTGAGHGIGLCQWGVAGMARAGKKYEEILRFYFPGSSVSSSGL